MSEKSDISQFDTSDDTSEAGEVPKEVEEFLMELNGVGPSVAAKLYNAGYTSYEDIAVTPPQDIALDTGIGEKIIEKIIQSARDKIDIGFMTAQEVLVSRRTVERFTTGVSDLDRILGGGVETGTLIEVYGEFRTGKTQIAHQLCITVQLPREEGGLEGKAIYIDCEGTFRPERLRQIARMYESIDQSKVLENVIFARAHNSAHLQIIVEKISKDILSKPDHNIRLIIIDSIISHFRSEFIGRGALSERQQRLNKLLHKLLQIAEAKGLVVYYTNQVLSNPGLYFGDPTQPVGGHIIAHTSTFRLQLKKSRGDKRVARLIDSPCLPESDGVFRITENGIEDA
jgi:DNA repair protein RadA